MSKQNFTSKLEKAGSWVIVRVPFDAKALFGTAGYTPIRGSIDGHAFHDLTLMPMGNGVHCFPVKAALRKTLGKQSGDPVHVILEKNPDPPVVTEPGELKEALKASAEARKAYKSLSPSMRREHCRYIAEGKQRETRVKRAIATVLKLERIHLEKPAARTKKKS